MAPQAAAQQDDSDLRAGTDPVLHPGGHEHLRITSVARNSGTDGGVASGLGGESLGTRGLIAGRSEVALGSFRRNNSDASSWGSSLSSS